MTHDLLQSDIDLATRLMVEGRADEQIIRALAHRRLDPAKAAQLVDDLRHGRKVITQPALPAEFTLRRSHSRHAAREGVAPSPARSPKPKRRSQPPAAPAAPGRKKPTVIWVVGAILLLLVLVVVGSALFQRFQPGQRSAAEPASAAPAAPTDGGARGGPAGVDPLTDRVSPGALALELQPDGLRLRGQRLTRDNLLPTLVSLLGPPDRTNQVNQAGTVIYAFDRHGLLICSQAGGGTNSIVLDCEASGGAHGTTTPFTGVLRVEDQVIGPDTDSQVLPAIKQLALTPPQPGGTIWNARYPSVDLVFVYLRSPHRPSLIELDLK